MFIINNINKKGCDTGFGLILAKHLHKLGFKVFAGCLLKDKDGEGGQELQKIDSPNLVVLQLDVTEQSDWDKAIDTIGKASPNGLYGLVNNAGWATFGQVEWVSEATMSKIIDINLMGVFRGVKACAPLLRKGNGRVVTVTSCLARWAVPNRSPYVATKCALQGFSECLRHEMRKFGVKVSN